MVDDDLRDDPIYAYLQRIHETIVNLSLDKIGDTVYGLEDIMTDAENDHGETDSSLDDARLSIIQSVASVASSSLELWMNHLTNTNSMLFRFLFSRKEILGDLYPLTEQETSRSNRAINIFSHHRNLEEQEDENIWWGNFTGIPVGSWFQEYWSYYALDWTPVRDYTMTDFDYFCFLRIVIGIVLRDSFGGLRRILIPAILSAINPNPVTIATIPLRFLRGAITSSVVVLGISLPPPLLFFLLGRFLEFWIDFWYNIQLPFELFPQRNITAVCNPFTWTLRNETNATSFFNASAFVN